jgi:hypothetical protein
VLRVLKRSVSTLGVPHRRPPRALTNGLRKLSSTAWWAINQPQRGAPPHVTDTPMYGKRSNCPAAPASDFGCRAMDDLTNRYLDRN